MRKVFLLLSIVLLSSSVSACLAAPVADDDDDDDAKPAAKPTATAKPAAKPAAKPKSTQSKSKSKGGGVKLGDIGHALKTGSGRAAAIAAGFAVGTPVAVVRLIARADDEQSEAVPFLGESKNKAAKTIAHMLVIPTAFFSGTVQAPVYSAMNAWKQSDENPFGPESFFFGDLDSRVPQ